GSRELASCLGSRPGCLELLDQRLPCDGSALNGSNRYGLLLFPSLCANFCYSAANLLFLFQPSAVAFAGLVIGLFVGVSGGFAASEQLCEALTALVLQHGVSLW